MLTRREFLAASTAAAALAATPPGALAQTPKKGGTLTVRAWDPPHFDHSLVHAYSCSASTTPASRATGATSRIPRSTTCSSGSAGPWT